MIDLVALHGDEKDNLVLMIFHNVVLTGYEINNEDKELTFFYTHSQNEANCSKDETDFETFIWMDDGKTLVDPHDRYEGICINHLWYPRGDCSMDEYLEKIRIPLENELTDQTIDQLTK